MGRLGNIIKADLQSSVVRLGLFAEFYFDSGTEKFWTGESDLGGYTGGGLIGGVDMEGEGDSLAARRVIYTLNNVDRAYYAVAVSTNYRNRPARLYIGTLNSDATAIRQLYLLEEGRMDTMEIGKDGTLKLTVESRLLDMFRPNPYRMTSADHKRIYPTDDFYEYVPFLPTAELPWGLESKSTSGGSAGGGGATGGGRPPLYVTG